MISPALAPVLIVNALPERLRLAAAISRPVVTLRTMISAAVLGV